MQELNQAEDIKPVSYTHLDVYKRKKSLHTQQKRYEIVFFQRWVILFFRQHYAELL